MVFLCVDIGGTNTLIGAGNGGFEVVEKVKSQEFLEDIGECLENTFSNQTLEKVDSVAVAAAGPIDREEGVFYPPNIPDMDEVQIKKPLEEFAEVKIVNDCASAVLGEYYYGEHNVENLLYVTISSGIGAGLIIDGHLAEGWNGNIGEVGHIEVGQDNMECGCGGTDHWEAYCSGNSLPWLAKRVTEDDYEDAREVFQKARKGDKNAEKVLEKMNEINAQAFSDLINLYNPEKIVLGGAVALNHPEVVVEPLEDAVEDQIINRKPDIELCALEEEAVIHGLRAVCNGKLNDRCC